MRLVETVLGMSTVLCAIMIVISLYEIGVTSMSSDEARPSVAHETWLFQITGIGFNVSDCRPARVGGRKQSNQTDSVLKTEC